MIGVTVGLLNKLVRFVAGAVSVLAFRTYQGVRDLGSKKRLGYFKRNVKYIVSSCFLAAIGAAKFKEAWPDPPTPVFHALEVAAALSCLVLATGVFVSVTEIVAGSPTARAVKLALLRTHRKLRHSHLPMLRDVDEYESRGAKTQGECDER